MQELIDKIMENGLTEDQAMKTLESLKLWLDEHYPVAGALASSLIPREQMKS